MKRLTTFLLRQSMWVLLAAGLMVWSAESSGAAGERRPHASTDNTGAQTRVTVPVATTPTPQSTSTDRQPSARDTRRIPPEQYRHPRPPSGGKPGGGGGHPHGGYSWYHYPGYYYPWRSPWYWSWGYWGPYWYWAPPAPVYTVRSVRSELGAIDLNVKPKKAAVYVDGEYAGLAKDFDGYPGFLWLEPGNYEISLFMPGYRTSSRTFEIRTGELLDVKLRMEPGEATRPVKTAASNVMPLPGREESAAAPSPGPREQEVARSTGLVRFAIEPVDATVYLDDRFLGSGGELAQLHSGLVVSTGRHRIEVVRPGFESRSLEIWVEEGVEFEVALTLGEETEAR